MRRLLGLCVLVLATPASAQDGRAVFDTRCASCHESADARTPTVASLRQRSPESILDALTSGAMRVQGTDLS
ncbi:MAG: c-type cytochrome, partial [Vicinamibacterales bacterium]